MARIVFHKTAQFHRLHGGAERGHQNFFHGDAVVAGEFPGDEEAAGAALAWAHSGSCDSFDLVDRAITVGDCLSDIGQGDVLAAANERVVMLSHGS